jgi:hypothetical protein
MATENAPPRPRQVTVQPQALPPEQGQPHVPHEPVATPDESDEEPPPRSGAVPSQPGAPASH